MKTMIKLALAAVLLGSSAIAGISAHAKDEAPAAAPAAQEVELQDGTKVTIDGEKVSVIGADGVAAAAPDGTWTTKDGKTITTKGGMIAK